MRNAPTRLLLAVVAVIALSATATATASATEFTFSKTGTLAGKQEGAQSFTTAAGNFSCATDKISGSATKLKTATQTITVQYEKCFLLGVKLTATPAEYELNTNGTFKILKEFTLTGASCKITFPAQSLSGVSYKNTSGKVELISGVAHIASFGTGSFCLYTEKEPSGVFEGRSLLELVGGTVQVI